MGGGGDEKRRPRTGRNSVQGKGEGAVREATNRLCVSFSASAQHCTAAQRCTMIGSFPSLCEGERRRPWSLSLALAPWSLVRVPNVRSWHLRIALTIVAGGTEQGWPGREHWARGRVRPFQILPKERRLGNVRHTLTLAKSKKRARQIQFIMFVLWSLTLLSANPSVNFFHCLQDGRHSSRYISQVRGK